MNKQIKKHLEKRGVRLMKEKRTDGLFGPDRRAACFFKWFFEEVMHFDSLEYRRQFWRAASRYGHTIGDMPRTAWEFTDPKEHPYNQWVVNLVFMMIMMGVSAVIWCLVKEATRHVRRLRRPTYYENERARRLALAEERRRIHARSTTNACPTPEQLKKAFEDARLSPVNMIRFGSLLEDLECFVNNKPYWSLETGRIVGRHGGIRQWLHDNAPELSARYKTIMRYKALSKKFRQAVGICDPTPASAVLPEERKSRDEERAFLVSKTERNGSFTEKSKGNTGRQHESSANENIARTNSEHGPCTSESGTKGLVGLLGYTQGRANTRGKTNVLGMENVQGMEKANGTERLQEMSHWGRAEPGKVENENIDRTERIVREILGTCEGTVVSLEARVMLYIGAEFIPEGGAISKEGAVSKEGAIAKGRVV